MMADNPRLGPVPPTSPELLALLEKAKAAYEAMAPEQKEAMHKAQRESWVRANMSTGDPRWD